MINQSFIFQYFNNFITALTRIFSGKTSGRRREISIFTYNFFNRQIIFFCQIKIFKTVRRSNGHGAGSKFFINNRISNYLSFYFSFNPFNFKFFSMKIFITFVLRMNNQNFVQKLCFRPHRTNYNRTIFKIIKFCFLIFVLHLIISQSRLATRTPIYNSISTINQTIVMHHFKHGANRKTAFTIQSKSFARPIA